MAEGDAPSSLLVWSLASFHTALLVALLVFGLYLSGAAGDLLSGLETAIGVGIYLYLWAITWWTNRRWLASIGFAVVDSPEPRGMLVAAAKWGGVTGLLFLAGVLVPAIAFFVASGGPGAIPFVLLATLVGGALSFAVGAVVGVSFAALDLLLLRASGI